MAGLEKVHTRELAKEWGLAPGQMGLIGSIGLIGMALGAVVSGTIADRIGRKKVFTITVLLYSIASASAPCPGIINPCSSSAFSSASAWVGNCP